MRKAYSILTVLAALFFITACNNKLNILSPYKNVTVVYGLMDQSDTAHYIRVNKAFEGLGNAYTMAQQFDSSYYPANQLNVQLVCFNGYGTKVSTTTLTADSSILLPPGTFSYPKQILYKTKAKLSVLDIYGNNNTYQLVVTNLKTGQVLYGSTQLLPDVTFTQGLGGTSSSALPMSSSSSNPSLIKWNSSINGRIYQMAFRFFYHEQTGSFNGERYFDWIFSPQTSSTIAGGQSMEYSYSEQEFFQEVRTTVPIIAGAVRRADSIQVLFTTGSDDFNTYIQLSQPSLGLNQDIPSYSDVKNGIGIYTARHTQIATRQISANVFDTLVNGTEFSAYGFQ